MLLPQDPAGTSEHHPITELLTPGALFMKNRGAGVPADQGGGNFKPRPNPLVVPGAEDRRAAIARLEGMEDVLVSGVHLNTEQSRVTIHDLPDRPGNCSKGTMPGLNNQGRRWGMAPPTTINRTEGRR